MIESALAAGMMSMGADVASLGVFPTPGCSFALRCGDCSGGAIVSASHNPAEYNGIKFFDANGTKLSDADEAEIESIYFSENAHDLPTGRNVGMLRDGSDRRSGYIEWLAGIASKIGASHSSLVVDAAHGAASVIARDIFARLGSVRFIGADPNGDNINDGAGVMCIDKLAEEVVRSGADLGIAFDGDADRTLFCDSRGRTIDGDVIMWTTARYLSKENALGAGLVATVMSNMALEEHLSKENIKVFRCPVGDRYVLEKMRESGAKLGGEQSGHVIAIDSSGTGDGMLTALSFIRACESLGEEISTLNDRFARYPQTLRNVRVSDRDAVMNDPEVLAAIDEAERELGSIGRVFLRPSGTEPLVRVLVECRDGELMKKVADRAEDALKRSAAKR